MLPGSQRHLLHLLGATAFLLRLEREDPRRGLGGVLFGPIDDWDDTLPLPSGPIGVRQYRPARPGAVPAVILVPGLHANGADDPRVRALARNLAMLGLRVVTPRIRQLAELGLFREGIEVIGETAQHLATAHDLPGVGFLGTSFGGGLGLLAACDTAHAERFSFVLAIGAHHDLEGVVRWYMGDDLRGPSGEVPPVPPDPYGIQILAHMAADTFVPPHELCAARRVLELALADQAVEARHALGDLADAESKRLLSALLDDPRSAQREPAYRAAVDAGSARLAAVSPRGRLGGARCPVFLLHGANDAIIPAVETLRMAREIPEPFRGGAVVTRYLGHVGRDSGSSWGERWELVQLMARVLGVARRGVR